MYSYVPSKPYCCVIRGPHAGKQSHGDKPAGCAPRAEKQWRGKSQLFRARPYLSCSLVAPPLTAVVISTSTSRRFHDTCPILLCVPLCSRIPLFAPAAVPTFPFCTYRCCTVPSSQSSLFLPPPGPQLIGAGGCGDILLLLLPSSSSSPLVAHFSRHATRATNQPTNRKRNKPPQMFSSAYYLCISGKTLH